MVFWIRLWNYLVQQTIWTIIEQKKMLFLFQESFSAPFTRIFFE